MSKYLRCFPRIVVPANASPSVRVWHCGSCKSTGITCNLWPPNEQGEEDAVAYMASESHRRHLMYDPGAPTCLSNREVTIANGFEGA